MWKVNWLLHSRNQSTTMKYRDVLDELQYCYMTSWIVCRLMCWPLKLFITSLSIKSYLCLIPPKLRSFNQIKAHATNQWAKIRYLFYLSTDIFYFRLQRLLPWNLSCTQENLWDLWIWKEWCLDSPYVRCVLASRPFHSLNVHFIV